MDPADLDSEPAFRAGPSLDPVSCSGCGKQLDPLRAGHVAIFDLAFHFFCDRARCRAAFLGEAGDEAREAPASPRRPRLPPAEAGAIGPAHAALPLPPELPPRVAPSLEERPLVEPLGRTILADAPELEGAGEVRDASLLLLFIALAAGLLAVVLGLAGEARLVVAARVVLALVGAGMLAGRAATSDRDVADPPALPSVLAPLAAVLVAAASLLHPDPALAAEAATLAGLLVAAAAAGVWLLDVARAKVVEEREAVAYALSAPARRALDAESGASDSAEREASAFDVRPGEAVRVEAGEVVPVDLRIASGEAMVLPWPGARTPARRREGDLLVSGARLISGRLRGVCTASGPDRAYARTLLDPRRRADALAAVAHASRSLVGRFSYAVAAAAGLVVFLTRQAIPETFFEIAMTIAAVQAAVASPLAAALPSAHVARGVLLALRRGVVYRSADAYDRAGRVDVAVFCARGTLLLGEPELAEVFSFGPRTRDEDVLALAAGAERSATHPVGAAIVRAARQRRVRPDAVRNAHAVPGLGVTAVTSGGDPLLVGSRALMLEQRVSIASAEERIGELESGGRSVVLVAVSGRLVGLLALQDGLRPGARAAVQHLLDVQVEPVLMSGDARETCETIGRSLDIDHVRPEIVPADRSAEVRHLQGGGVSVAVVGHPELDEGALSAADVAVALSAAGDGSSEHAVQLASDDVRDAALSLALAKRTRVLARTALGLAAAPALAGSLVVALGFLPAAYAPIASLLGGVMAALHLLALERQREGSAPPGLDGPRAGPDSFAP